jgi:hypothetical protein
LLARDGEHHIEDCAETRRIESIQRNRAGRGWIPKLIAHCDPQAVAEMIVIGCGLAEALVERREILRGRMGAKCVRSDARAALSDEALFFALALDDLRRAADLFRPAFAATDGVDGWASIELSPTLAADSDGSISAAKKLHAQADRPNIFVKIPGTPEGIAAIEASIFDGIPINVTLLFSRDQYVAAADAYVRGIERRIAAGRDPRVASVASLFVSRWDRKVADTVPSSLRNRLGIAMGAFRGIFVNWLWMRANDLKEQGKYYEAVDLAKTITRLQPRFPRVWAFHAWNLAYNISVATNTPPTGRSRALRRGGACCASSRRTSTG